MAAAVGVTRFAFGDILFHNSDPPIRLTNSPARIAGVQPQRVRFGADTLLFAFATSKTGEIATRVLASDVPERRDALNRGSPDSENDVDADLSMSSTTIDGM